MTRSSLLALGGAILLASGAASVMAKTDAPMSNKPTTASDSMAKPEKAHKMKLKTADRKNPDTTAKAAPPVTTTPH